MLDNTITLPVDILANGTLVDRVYSRFEEFQSRTIYKGPSHSLTSKDMLSFYRTPVRRSGNDNGVAKSAAKFTMDISVPGVDASTSLVKPMIAGTDFSIPVGATPAQTLEFRQRVIALLDHAIAARLVNDLEV